MENVKPILVLIIGPEGSGKRSFAGLFKNSFLQAFPKKPIYQGILSGLSFSAITDLTDEKEMGFIEMAYERGYRIICYLLFSSRLLCAERNRLSALKEKRLWHEEGSRERYEGLYRGVLAIYPYIDVVFFVENQKAFRFLEAYSIEETPASSFERLLRAQKAEADRLRTK